MRVAATILCIALLLAGCMSDFRQADQPTPKTVFTVLLGQSNSDPGLEDILTQKINKDFPNVMLEWESVDWGEYFASELQAKLASGEVPDLIIGKAQDVVAYQPSGYLATFDSSFYSGIKEEALESVTVDGKVYGLPYDACWQGVIYNKNIFLRYGVEPPQTLAEMDALIEYFQMVGVTPFATHFRENWYVGNVTMQFAVNQVFLENPRWGDEFRAGLQSFSESGNYADCFRQVETLLENTWSDALSVNQYECAKRFAGEGAAMYLSGTWSMQTLSALHLDMEIGIFPYPNEDGTAKLLFEPNLTFLKNAKSENVQYTDEILRAIFADRELAYTLCAFTQMESLLKDVESGSLKQIRKDINKYRDSDRIVDVTIGNRQMIWQFQDDCALKIYDWLEGKISFEDVLLFADSIRAESGS